MNVPVGVVGSSDKASRAQRAGIVPNLDDYRWYWQQINGDSFEHDQPHVILNANNLEYEASGSDYPGIYRCVGVGQTFQLSFGKYPLNRWALVDVVSGTVNLYSGDGIFAWRGTDTTLSKTESTFTSVVFDAAASTCTFAAGDPVAEGFAVGDLIRFVNTATNALTVFQIRAFGGTSNRTLTLWPEPETDATPDTAFTVQRRGTTQISVTGPAMVLVVKSQVDIAATSLTLFTTSSAASLPTPDELRAYLGQSWDVRMAAAASRGQQLHRQELSLPALVYNIDAATGAQAIAGQNNTTDNALWDVVNDQPGKNYESSLTRITRALRAYPSKTLKHAQMSLGVGDVANLTVDGGWLTWQVMLSAYEAAIAQYVEDLNAYSSGAGDALRFWISPMQSIQRSQGVLPYTDVGCNLVRFVQMSVVQRNPTNVRRGIELYHRAQPFDDVHQPERTMGSIGRELEHVWLRDDDSATYNHGRGPKITSFTQEARDVVLIGIDRLGGLTGVNVGLLYKPDVLPVGFGIVPDFDLMQESVGIVGYEWSGDNLRLFLDRQTDGAMPVYPYGQNNQAPIAGSRIVSVYNRVLEQYQPLQTLAHTYDEAAGIWAPDFTT